MSQTDLQGIAQAVTRRAQRQGFILPREVREELQLAGLDDGLWKDVLALTRSTLRYRQGRYYYVSALSARVREEQRHQQAIHRTVRQLIRQHKQSAGQDERRQQDRIDFILPLKVRTDDEREMTLLSRDLSTTGIRLIGTRSLLGQKIRVLVPRGEGAEPWCFLVRILWTCAVGDNLFENGGSFLELAETPAAEPGLRLHSEM
jgi:hypothetical protein